MSKSLSEASDNRGRHACWASRPRRSWISTITRLGQLPRPLLGLALLLAGCASSPPDQLELMPAPEVFQDGKIDPFEGLRPRGRWIETDILYATDRDPASVEDAERYYANRRGYLVRLGHAELVHEDGQLTWEAARKLSLARDRKTPYRLRIGDVEEIGILADSASPFTDPAQLPADREGPATEFAAAVNRKLARSKNRDIVIYVHGYKVPFEDPLWVSTELWHFLGYDGVFIPYSWPSTPSLLAYMSDIETARLSAHYLRLFIGYLSEQTDAERIHILGYSAGTRLVIDALSMLAADGPKRARGGRIGEVILVGSDYDKGLFAAALTNGILDATDRITVYLSAIDRALRFSNFLFGRERLGEILDSGMPDHVRALLRRRDDLVLIEVTDAENAGARNGHAYFRASPWVSSDILATLVLGLGPARRGLVREDPSLPIWSYPTDFVERLRAALATDSAGTSEIR